jgi:DNA-binding NarL/FixJ family response regulator
MPIRTLIADDHTIFRNGLRALLEQEADIEVVGETGDGFDTIRAVKETEVDVLLLDLKMPGLSGAKVAESVLEDRPHLAVVVLTMHEDDYYLRELFKIGVRGFVLKKSTGRDLLQAIRAAYRGKEYIDPSMAGQLISSLIFRPKSKTSARLEQLTPREQEVCTLLAYGHTNAERAELVRFAIDYGLLKLSE